jgi:hypothetical protein
MKELLHKEEAIGLDLELKIMPTREFMHICRVTREIPIRELYEMHESEKVLCLDMAFQQNLSGFTIREPRNDNHQRPL